MIKLKMMLINLLISKYLFNTEKLDSKKENATFIKVMFMLIFKLQLILSKHCISITLNKNL